MTRLPQHFFAMTLTLSQLCLMPMFAEASKATKEMTTTNSESLDNKALSEGDTPLKQVWIDKPLEFFTGKIARDKVRMRLQPSLEATILRELNKDDLLIVIGEAEEFYAVKPPKDIKAYVFRTFVLDNTIEGDKVNVRLEPALESPVIAQLPRGSHVEGTISALNSKWLEIAPPASTRFYVCKEYVEKVGSPEVMAQLEQRRREVNALLHNAYLSSQSELQKDFPAIDLDKVLLDFHNVITQYADFPDQVARAKELLSNTQERYLQKKIAHLESRASSAEAKLTNTMSRARKNQDRSNDNPDSNLAPNLEQPLSEPYKNVDKLNLQNYTWEELLNHTAMTPKMATWIPVERRLYEHWLAEGHSRPTVDAYYKQQMDEIIVMSGIIEPYNRTVKNKPGDYLLLSRANNAPIAFLYSTKIDLQPRIGSEATIYAIKRPNYNFAFPAYFVVEIE